MKFGTEMYLPEVSVSSTMGGWLCCWLLHRYVEVNFSKLMDSNQIFRNDFGCLYYHQCNISSQINDCKIFSPHDFLELTL